MAKWDNLLSLLWMLRGGRKLTAAKLADSLEISVRTVYRYIDALCASGVPIVAGPGHDGGFRILENFQETPLFFRAYGASGHGGKSALQRDQGRRLRTEPM